jgi:hypothetical protein
MHACAKLGPISRCPRFGTTSMSYGSWWVCWYRLRKGGLDIPSYTYVLIHLFSFAIVLTIPQELSQTLQSTDCLRFSRYAPFVRCLHYNIHCPTHKNLHHSEIARTRLQLNILPNLDTLHWTPSNMNDLGMSVMFMHERVKNFMAWIPFDTDL